MLIKFGRLMGRGNNAGGGTAVPRIVLSASAIAENASVDDVVGLLAVINGSGTYAFSITSNPGGLFKIANDDELQVAAGLNHEATSSVTLEITADNSVDDPLVREFTIQITNVLEVTLGALSLSADEIDENSAENTVVGAVVGATSGSTVTVHDSAGGRFKLSGGNIVAASTSTDYEAATSHNITLRETHPDASNSPRDTVIPISVLNDPDDTDTAPDAFEAGDWSIAAGDAEADVTISDLPANGGDAITDIEYRLDGGSWVSSGGTTDFTITGLTNDTEYDVQLRAVNGVGAGVASDTKAVTPLEPEASGIIGLSGLALFLKAAEVSTLKQSNAGTTDVTADSQPVGHWGDLSPNAFHFTSIADDTTRPTYHTDGMYHWVEGDGTNDILRRTAALGMYAAGACSVFIAMRSNNGPNREVLLTERSSASGNPLYQIWNSFTDADDLSIIIRNDASVLMIAFDASFADEVVDGTDFVFGVTDSGSTLTVYDNGTQVDADSYTRSGSVTVNRTSLFASFASDAAGDWISARIYGLCVVLGRVVTSEERSMIVAELAALMPPP